MTVAAGDEGRHEPDGDPLWNESWYFDFATEDGRMGGYIRLGLYPNQNVAWWWSALVREGEPALLVRHHEVALPRGASLEVRAEGLWGALHLEAPHDHWTVGLEAFALGLDDPAEALAAERGDLVPLGFDLEWEAAADPWPYPGVTRYEQSCRVHGEVLFGDRTVEVAATGQRDHSWGRRDWWSFGWCWTSGHLDDGTWFHATRPGVPGVRYERGYVVAPSSSTPQAVDGVDVGVADGPPGLPPGGTVTLRGPGAERLDLDVTAVAHAPVRLDAPDGRTGHLARALCRFHDRSSGRAGVGWTEWNQPPAPPPTV